MQNRPSAFSVILSHFVVPCVCFVAVMAATFMVLRNFMVIDWFLVVSIASVQMIALLENTLKKLDLSAGRAYLVRMVYVASVFAVMVQMLSQRFLFAQAVVRSLAVVAIIIVYDAFVLWRNGRKNS